MRTLVLSAACATLALAGAEETFRDTVYPVLQRDCLGCHGADQKMAGLDLRTREVALKGGGRGPSMIPGKAAESLLYRALAHDGALQMPPGGAAKKLPAETIAAFREWIDGGAPWSTSPPAASKWNYKPEDLWAFQPLRTKFDFDSVDAFLNAKLRDKGVQPGPTADRRTLIRRVTINLTGLPPTPEEVAAFVADRSPDAWRKLVDRLLDSPRYGERWARHWLDVVRYADTSGYSNDFERPNAWRYRDYVIRVFNTDKPYDRFLKEQIAGDELFPGDAEALIATGFLRAGPWEHTGMSVEAVTRQMFLDDVTHATTATFLGLTAGCARCHDHKFDPIPTRDYYSVQAVFATTEFARPKLAFLPVENVAGMSQDKARMAEVARRTREGMDRFDDIAVENAMRQHGVARREDLPKGIAEKAKRDKLGIGPEEFEVFKLYQKHAAIYKESLDRFEPKAFVVSSGPWDGATDGGPNLRYPKKAEYKAPEVRVLRNGDVQSPGEAVTPGAWTAVERYSGLAAPPIPDSVTGRRAALANWIADPKHPQTARVMVNRIWQYHFGRGIAADANNFGKMGAKPSHPELLDWLAARFIASGWSIKAMHRLILMTDAYRRASGDSDPSLLASFPPRRIEAEVLRDSILSVSGQLSDATGGPGAFPQLNEDVARQPRHAMGSLQPAYYPSPRKRDRNKRTIYMFQQRSLVDPMIDVFNGPTLDMSCERREASTVPTQAFTLLNSRFVHEMALEMAARAAQAGSGTEARVDRAFELAYQRKPEAAERRAALAHVAKMTAEHRRTPPPPEPEAKPIVHTITSELTGEQFQFRQQADPAPFEAQLKPAEVGPEVRALADLALVLLNSNEFVYVY